LFSEPCGSVLNLLTWVTYIPTGRAWVTCINPSHQNMPAHIQNFGLGRQGLLGWAVSHGPIEMTNTWSGGEMPRSVWTSGMRWIQNWTLPSKITSTLSLATLTSTSRLCCLWMQSSDGCGVPYRVSKSILIADRLVLPSLNYNIFTYTTQGGGMSAECYVTKK